MKEKRLYGIYAALLLAVGTAGCGALTDTQESAYIEGSPQPETTMPAGAQQAGKERVPAEETRAQERADGETLTQADEECDAARTLTQTDTFADGAGGIAQIREMQAESIVDVSGLSQEDITALFYAEEISDTVLARIDGCSYRENEDISLEELCYVRVLYMGFDGETHIGELIVNDKISSDILEIMQALYRAAYPIERMVLVDAYGGDDGLSMAANNTSAFNYRNVPGTGRLSNHSYGLAIDINPLYNPYIRTSSDGSVRCDPKEGEAFADREQDFPYKIDHEDLCYELFTAHGFAWGGDWKSVKDYQHFEKTR